MFAAPPNSSILNSKKKKKEESFIIGGPDHNKAFGGIGKLLNGFCDPNQMDDDDDDNSTIDSTPSSSGYNPGGGDKSREVTLVEGPGLSYGVNNNGDSTSVLQYKPDPPTVTVVKEEKEVVVKEPVLKASNVGPKLRRKRGLEVTIVGIVFVMGTLFALHRMGYEFDLKVVKTQMKSGIDIVFHENDGTGVPEKMKKWIDIAFKKEPVEDVEKVEDVELKRKQDQEDNKAEGLDSQEEVEKAEGLESLDSQEEETETEVVEDESTIDDVAKDESSTEDKPPEVAAKRPVSDTVDTLDSDSDKAPAAEAQAKLEAELLADILGEEL